MSNLVYSATDPNRSGGGTFYTFSAGEPLCTKDAMNYAYFSNEEQQVQVWIESAGGSSSPGDNVLTGDSVYIKCALVTDHYLDSYASETYVRWTDEGLGDGTWTIHFHGDDSSGQVIPLGQPFVLWNVNRNLAVSPGDGNFCVLGDGSDVWSITAS